MAIAIPPDVRELLDAPNYVHLATLRADGSARNWVVWVSLEGDHILVCTSDASGISRATGHPGGASYCRWPSGTCRPPGHRTRQLTRSLARECY